MKAYAGCLSLIVGLGALAGQTPAPVQTQSENVPIMMSFPGTAYSMRVTTGKPYSATEVTEHTQTLADGTHITSPTRSVVTYRDSLGRTRVERPIGQPSLAGEYHIVEIRDPVAQVQYTLDPVNKVAHRVAMQAPPHAEPPATGVVSALSGAPPPSPAPTASAPDKPQFQVEDLGPQVMEGLAVHGTKHTTTVPVGAQGNDRPLVTVRELWVSRDYGFTVLSHVLDPRSGETTAKMTDISTSEPDPSQFAPPSDYSVVDESGPFKIKFYPQPKQQQ